MSLNLAHEGYEYQDLLSAYFILKWILDDVKTTFLIDRKEYTIDKFDDITIKNEHGIFKNQIKYSNNDSNHSLQKSDLSTDGTYKLSIDTLFHSWVSNARKYDTEIRLCLAWNEPTDGLLEILNPIISIGTFKNHKTNQYKIDVEKLWPNGKEPIKNWKRFKRESKNIDRNLFIEFCDKLIIETNFPKSSTYIYEPDELEKIVLDQVERLGIGIFPNNNWKKEEFVLSLVALIKKARSKNIQITTVEIFSQFQIKTDFGSIEQNFPIDNSKNITLKNQVELFLKNLNIDKRIILTGEPGSGKSWFISNLIIALKKKNIKTIKHYCYTDIQDRFQKERIKINVFYGNLISDLIKIYPHLQNVKRYKYASNLSELNLLIENIDEPTVLIIDGLDHIERVHSLRPNTDVSINEIEIINEISKIKCTNYLSIVVASQPISELDNIVGYKKTTVLSWTIQEVRELMSKLYVSDVRIEGDSLSEILLNKSKGNPLYLTYLIEEIKNIQVLNKDILSILPPYSFNLENYYSYLLSKLNLREQIPQVLSSVNFSLTEAELKEITGLGSFVNESLDLLRPVIKQNFSSNGYVIYHESFRRFIIEYLRKKGINVEKIVFLPVIKWFEKLDFFSYPKAYRYYLQVLIDGEYYKEAVGFISKDFVKNSIYAGQPWSIIKNNYYFLLKAATEEKNVSLIILLNEINKVLSSTEDSYDEAFSLYIESLKHCYNVNRVIDFLTFEGQPTLSLHKGLNVCYLIDDKNAVAPWDQYFQYFEKGEKINQEDFKFYVRYFLVNSDIEELKKIAKKLKRKNLNDFANIYTFELKRFWNQDLIKELIDSEEDVKRVFDKENSKTIKIKLQDLNLLADKINLFEHFHGSELETLTNFFDQIKYQINNDSVILNVIQKFTAKNWFYNWVIFCIKIEQIRAIPNINSDELKSAFSFLGYNTKPFEGKPRACDLFSLKDVIYDSISRALFLVKTKEEWEHVLIILEKVSDETTTSLQKSLGGPLTMDKLYQLCIDKLNDQNINIIIEVLERQFNDKKEFHLHHYITEYCFQLSRAFAFVKDNKKVEYYFKLGVDFMLGYTMRRDLTIEDLTECIEGISTIDNELGNKYILDLKELVDSVVEHTDGKDTKHFPVEWFEKFFNINPMNASLYLLKELTDIRYDWRLEASLTYLLIKSNGKINELTESLLIQTILIETNESFLINSLDLISKLNSILHKKILVTSISNKIEIKRSSAYSANFQDKYIQHFAEFGLTDKYISSFKRDNKQKKYSNNSIIKFNKQFISRREFSDMSSDELIDYLKDHSILRNDLQSLIYVFDNFKELNIKLKDLIQDLIKKNERHYDNDDNIDISPLFESNNDISIYFWISRFVCQTDGWYKSLSNIKAFTTAYNLNPKRSLEFLFELLPSKLSLGFNRTFSANLLNALCAVKYNSLELKEAWLLLYEMIESRLPSSESYEWANVLENKFNMNFDEIYICLLISRFKSYTIQKFHIVLSSVSILLYEDSERLVKPLKWFFSNYESFKKSVLLAILELLHIHEKEKPGYLNNFEFELKEMYPLNYFLIDYIIEDSFDMPVHFRLSPNELIYPISDAELDFYMSINIRHEILENVGVKLNNIFGKCKATFVRDNRENLELYGNRSHERVVRNIFFSDYILSLINTDLYNRFKRFENIDDVYDNLKIDIKSIIAQYLSSNIRPRSLKKSSEYEDRTSFTEEISNNNGWVRLAHFECELVEKNHFKLNEGKIFGGITFQNSNKPIFPFSRHRLNMNSIWLDDYPEFEINDTIIFTFIQKEFDIEDFKILWLNPTLLENLGIKICDFNNGLCATNIDNEIVLKFNSWCCDYIASDYSSNIDYEIPKLDGSELLIREDYYNEICKIYDVKPKYTIFKTPFKNNI